MNRISILTWPLARIPSRIIIWDMCQCSESHFLLLIRTSNFHIHLTAFQFTREDLVTMSDNNLLNQIHYFVDDIVYVSLGSR